MKSRRTTALYTIENGDALRVIVIQRVNLKQRCAFRGDILIHIHHLGLRLARLVRDEQLSETLLEESWIVSIPTEAFSDEAEAGQAAIREAKKNAKTQIVPADWEVVNTNTSSSEPCYYWFRVTRISKGELP